MKLFITTTFLVFSFAVNAQSSYKQYFDSLTRVKNPKAEIEAVSVYIIDGEYFTKHMETFEKKLAAIRHSQIKAIGYSPAKTCGYQPGKGMIYIRTVQDNDCQ